MREASEIDRKRAVLLETRLRFDPKVQPIKQSAIDSIVEQVLFAFGPAGGLTLQSIQSHFSAVADGFSPSIPDLEGSLDRLKNNKRIHKVTQHRQSNYILVDERHASIALIQDQAEKDYSSIIDRLFRNAPLGATTYGPPFLECVASILSSVIDEHIHWALGDVLNTSYFPASLTSTVRRVAAQHPAIDQEILQRGVERFFRETHPSFIGIKWTIAQNLYVMRAMGSHADSNLLSYEVFANANLYLDTNVIIRILDFNSAEHHAFLGFARACEQAGISIAVCKPSIDELNNWIQNQFDDLPMLASTVPPDLLPKVDAFFIDRYMTLRQQYEGEPTRHDILGSFNEPEKCLQGLLGIRLIDDPWFESAMSDADVERLAHSLVMRTVNGGRRVKPLGSARVDAQVLAWIDRQNHDGSKHWLVTLDRNLPGVVPQGSKSTSLAVPLATLFLWISPTVDVEDDETRLPTAFTRLVAERLLPPERLFTEQDFRLLHTIGLESYLLPPADVEDLILHLRSEAAHLNLGDANDRESLAYEINKFLSDPARMHHEEVARLTRLAKEERSEKEALQRQAAEDAEQVERLKRELAEQKSSEELRKRDQQLRKEAYIRLAVLTLAFAVSVALATSLTFRFGIGENWFQSIVWSLPLYGAIIALTIVAGRFLLGEARMHALGWSLSRLFKAGGD